MRVLTYETVCVSLVLRQRARTVAGRERVERLARELGLEPSHRGAATLSLRTSPRRFQEVFQQSVEAVGARPPTETDLGTTSGHSVTGPLTVPAALSDDVEAISVEPPALRLADP